MMPKSKTGTFAIGFFSFSAICILLAFVSPYWLVTDGKLNNPKFIKIGKYSITYFNYVFCLKPIKMKILHNRYNFGCFPI